MSARSRELEADISCAASSRANHALLASFAARSTSSAGRAYLALLHSLLTRPVGNTRIDSSSPISIVAMAGALLALFANTVRMFRAFRLVLPLNSLLQLIACPHKKARRSGSPNRARPSEGLQPGAGRAMTLCRLPATVGHDVWSAYSSTAVGRAGCFG